MTDARRPAFRPKLRDALVGVDPEPVIAKLEPLATPSRKQRLQETRDETGTELAAARGAAETELEQARSAVSAALDEARQSLRAQAEELADQAAERVLGRPL